MWRTFDDPPEEGVQILLKVLAKETNEAHYTDATRISNRLLSASGVYHIKSKAYILFWMYVYDFEQTLEIL